MNSAPKPTAAGPGGPTRVGVSDIKLTVSGVGAGGVASLLAQVGRAGLVDAVTAKVLNTAATAPGGRALTRAHAAAIATRIVERMIADLRRGQGS